MALPLCCAGWSVLCGAHTFPDTVVVKLKSVENIFLFFIYTSVVSSLCAVVLSSTTPSLLLFVRLSSVPIILHAKRTEDRMQEGS